MAASTEPVGEKKKSLFDTILTATPVLLTVVSTFMVGRSTAEMTQAQYHRAVAAQNQSKVADQWAFFQAKRIRGGDNELTAMALNVTTSPQPVSMASLTKDLERIGSSLGGEESGKFVDDAKKALVALKSELAGDKTSNIQDAVAALDPEAKIVAPLPATSDSTDDKAKEQAEMLKKIVDSIRARAEEDELIGNAMKVDEKTLGKAIAEANKRADAVSKEGDRLDDALGKVDKLVQRLTMAARAALDGAKNASLKEALERLVADYTVARMGFNARRMRAEARSNQEAAFLYEAKVHVAGAKSDRHLDRSKKYMYAMLVAQVGVVLASLAMAVRQKSLVWMLATVAGLIAILWGVSVFLGMA